MRIAQITDCHIVEPGQLLHDRVDTAAMLGAAVDHINAMVPRPDIVVATGDLVNDGRPNQYRRLGEILAQLTLPLYVIPGNHDDRTELRAMFEHLPAGGPDDPVDYVVEDHDLRLVALDTSIPGRNDGELLDQQLAWLDATLAAEPTKPTMVLQHHPPFLTGIEWMDATALSSREAEAAVIDRHPQVTAIICGHVHRPVQALVGGAVATTWPSTGAQVALRLDGSRYVYAEDPPAVAIHQWSASAGVVSHTSYVSAAPTWVPAWARSATD